MPSWLPKSLKPSAPSLPAHVPLPGPSQAPIRQRTAAMASLEVPLPGLSLPPHQNYISATLDLPAATGKPTKVFGKIRIRTLEIQLCPQHQPKLPSTHNKRKKTSHTTAAASPSPPAARPAGNDCFSSPVILSTLRRAVPKIKSGKKYHHLQEFNKKLLGDKDYDVTTAALGELFYSILTSCNDVLFVRPAW